MENVPLLQTPLEMFNSRNEVLFSPHNTSSGSLPGFSLPVVSYNVHLCKETAPLSVITSYRYCKADVRPLEAFFCPGWTSLVPSLPSLEACALALDHHPCGPLDLLKFINILIKSDVIFLFSVCTYKLLIPSAQIPQWTFFFFTVHIPSSLSYM